MNIADSKPLVSVGIPTYNNPEGLRRTLQYITGQTYETLEIIISDDCSPDPETEAVAREFMEKDSRIQYFRQGENKGPSFNFKFVYEKATGEYFMWAADDDGWNQTYIEDGIKCMIETGATSVFGIDHVININTKQILKANSRFPPYKLNINNTDERIFQYLRGAMMNMYTDAMMYSLFRRKIFENFETHPQMNPALLFVFRIVGSGPLADCKSMILSKNIKSNDTNKTFPELCQFFGVTPSEYYKFVKFGYWQQYREMMRHISNKNKLKATLLFKRRYFGKNPFNWIKFISCILTSYFSKKRHELIL